MIELLTDEGFTGVLGTNCEQTYDRYLRVGEEVRVTTRAGVGGRAEGHGVGEGYFVTTRNIWYVGRASEQVASMLFRVLKFIPQGDVRRSATSSGPR